jgi:hypothetical protein
MNKFSRQIFVVFVIGLLAFGVDAQKRADQRQMNELLSNLSIKIDDFQYNVNSEVNQNAVGQADETTISDSLRAMRDDIDNLRNNAAAGRDSNNDVNQILNTARDLNDNLLKIKLNAKSQNDWKAVRGLLDQLASNYGIASSWNTSANRTNVNYNTNNLTGTYQLDSSRSDDVKQIVTEALQNATSPNGDAQRELEEKLESPNQLAIDIRGNQATLASSLAQQITLSADGQDRSQNLPDGSSIRLRTTLRGQELTIAKLGSDEDYTVTFTSLDNGKNLKVTRRMTTKYLSQTVFVESFYSKSDPVAKLDIYDESNNSSGNINAGNYPTNSGGSDPNNSGNDPNNSGGNSPSTTINQPTNYPPTARAPKIGQYIVPNGEIITGMLENEISTKVSQNNDRFKMRVTGPNQFRGAIVEGYITGIDRSNRNPIGSAKFTLNFETIRMANGQTYDFAGFLQRVTDDNGKNIKVDEEGTISKSSTRETAKRAGIGAGAGAILGAILGGAKGAVIGATIGAGGGAGSVAVQNKGDIELKPGSSLTIQSSAPGQ